MAPTRRWQVAAVGRGCVKTKTDLAVNQFCKIQTFKSRRFESRLEFLARFARFAKAPSVFTQPRPSVARCSQFPVSTPYRRSLPAAIGLAKWWRVVFLIQILSPINVQGIEKSKHQQKNNYNGEPQQDRVSELARRLASCRRRCVSANRRGLGGIARRCCGNG